MVRLTVPAYATWKQTRAEDAEPPKPRRCCFDEIAYSVAEKISCLQWLSLANGTMPATLLVTSKPGAARYVLHLLDSVLRGSSQVVIINNPIAGALILASLYFPSPLVGVHGTLGLLGATFAAYLLGFDAHAISSGLFGYNGLLVGMALATFLTRDAHEADPMILIASFALGGMSSVINLALGNALVPTFKTPPFTLAFNTTMLILLLASSHLEGFAMPHHAPVATTLDPDTPEVERFAGVDASWLLHSALVAVGQVFLCESAISGALILGGMAVSSRIAACAAYAGALGGSALALVLGVDHAAIGHGLWGYNSCLTAVAVFTFYVPSCKGCLMYAIGVCLTVLIGAAMRTAFAPHHMPVGTLPFCSASILLMLTHSGIPGFVPVPIDAVSTAEDHLYSAQISETTEISKHGGMAVIAEEAGGSFKTSTNDPVPPAGDDEGAAAGRVELAEIRIDDLHRAALVISPSRNSSRNNSVHGMRRWDATKSNPAHEERLCGQATPNSSAHAENRFAKAFVPSRGSSHHGSSHHGEMYLARQLSAMEAAGHARSPDLRLLRRNSAPSTSAASPAPSALRMLHGASNDGEDYVASQLARLTPAASGTRLAGLGGSGARLSGLDGAGARLCGLDGSGARLSALETRTVDLTGRSPTTEGGAVHGQNAFASVVEKNNEEA